MVRVELVHIVGIPADQNNLKCRDTTTLNSTVMFTL